MGRVGMAAVVGLMGLALAGCAAGQGAATARQLPSAPGVSVADGGIAVRNATLAFNPVGYEVGGTAPINLSIVNDTDSPVSLVVVTTSAADAVTVGDGAADLEIPASGAVNTTLRATGLRTELDGAGSIPLVLTFGDGTVLSLDVPVTPPAERTGEREPLVFDEGEH